MQVDTSTLMMIFFIISLWKVYVFLPNKQLHDDDRTKESKDELISIVLNIIKKDGKDLSLNDLFQKIKEDKNFDDKHYWRFNLNRLNQLLNSYYVNNPQTKSIADIHKNLN